MLTSHRAARITVLALALTGLLLVVPVNVAFAGNPSGTGQPNVECEDFALTPGNSADAPGSAFNEDGLSGTVYAGEQDNNTINEHTSSQYDTACFEISQH